MGKYLNPPLKLRQEGRKLETSLDYNELHAQLVDGELLFGLFNRGPFWQAPYLFNQDEAEEFLNQCANHIILQYEFYALDPEAAIQFGIKPFKEEKS